MYILIYICNFIIRLSETSTADKLFLALWRETSEALKWYEISLISIHHNNSLLTDSHPPRDILALLDSLCSAVYSWYIRTWRGKSSISYLSLSFSYQSYESKVINFRVLKLINFILSRVFQYTWPSSLST